ncbi:diphthamide biosynthesis protein 4 isoform X2 [Varroa jacobsoni]|uniref:J domain-containing protein n=1 Tax=Varroa destructor TaxID=109461 RepID=A0A7M7KZB3_VARDE|nr:dnaJ homolog subfamily C member 16 isoform X2 [Varroa destructor]XP_022700009.1 diphthamide biosynthesis protein 4 isoform X2 [Varroa jacobsoni]
MSYMMQHLHNGWQVDQAILSEEDRVVVIRFGHDWDPTCMKMDEVLYSIAEKDHYNVLGLKRTCSLDEVKQAYKKLVLRYHPDRRNGDEAKFHAIERAYKLMTATPTEPNEKITLVLPSQNSYSRLIQQHGFFPIQNPAKITTFNWTILLG